MRLAIVILARTSPPPVRIAKSTVASRSLTEYHRLAACGFGKTDHRLAACVTTNNKLRVVGLATDIDTAVYRKLASAAGLSDFAGPRYAHFRCALFLNWAGMNVAKQ